jgi:hypothetical protein
MIIGSALLEKTAERRVKTWIDNILKGRNSITLSKIALPEASIDSHAESLAAEAALRTGLSTTPGILRRAIDVVAMIGIGGLVSLRIIPWLGLISPFVAPGYRHLRGVSIGDDLSRCFLDTKRRFRRLGRRKPGRIEIST